MPGSTLREMVGHRGLKAGTLVWEFATPGIGHLLAAGGCDFVFLDTEHSGIDVGTLKRVLRYLEAADVPAIVRPPSRSYHHVARCLDAGAEGVILPMVSTEADARAIVDAAKYTPRGHRGIGLGIAHDRYAPAPVADALAAANERTVIFTIIETAEGVENVEAIAAVDGVDGLWIGHLDLSSSLGIPGQFEHPEYVAAVERVVAAARGAGKSLGRVVGSVEEGAAMHAMGHDFIGLGTDTQLFQQALAGGLGDLRARCAG